MARLWVENPAAFLVSTMGDLRITGGATVNDDILGRDIIFDTTAESEIVVNGTVHYLQELIGEENVHLSSDPVFVQSMTFPGVDLQRYRLLSQSLGDYHDTSSLNLNLSDLPPETPIVFAEGDIHISGSYDHSLIVVAGGNVYIEDNVVSSAIDQGNGQVVVPQIGILAKKDAIIPKDAPADITIEAFVMADGGEKANGEFVAEGNKLSKGSLNFTGAIAVRGDGDDTAVNLNAYAAREYTFNDELTTSRSIPFLPFIANQLPGTWREVNPSDPFPPAS